MIVIGILIGLFVWSIIGYVLTYELSENVRWRSDGFEYLNPRWMYQHYQVNWFGCILLFLWYLLLCPLGLVIYWFYKLCTVGRK
jgi:hypothetical protein